MLSNYACSTVNLNHLVVRVISGYTGYKNAMYAIQHYPFPVKCHIDVVFLANLQYLEVQAGINNVVNIHVYSLEVGLCLTSHNHISSSC